MNFAIENRNKTRIFIVKEKTVESRISAEFKAQMLIFAQADIKGFVVDLSMVEAIDSSGLGALLLAHRQLKEGNIPIIIVGAKDFVKSLMEMTRINELFAFYATVDDACNSIKESN